MEKPVTAFNAVGRMRTQDEIRDLLDELMERMLQAKELAEVLQVEVHILEWAQGAGVVPSSFRPRGD